MYNESRNKTWLSVVLALAVHGALFAIPIKEHTPERTVFNKISFVLADSKSEQSQKSPETHAPFSDPLPEPFKQQEPASEPPPEPEPKPEPESKPIPEPDPDLEPKTIPKPVHKPEPPPRPISESAPKPKQKPEEKQTPDPDPEPDSSEPVQNKMSPLEQPGPVQEIPLPSGPVQTAFGEPEGPRFKQRVIPEYPMRARRMNREGIVALELHIDEHGNLIEEKIVKKAGYGFDKAALKAVQQSTYFPAKRNGQPVDSRARLNIRFELR